MPVDPVLAPLLPVAPLPDDLDWPQLRERDAEQVGTFVGQLAQPAPDGVDRRVISLPVDGGEIDLVVHTPAVAGPLPVHIYLHGGGWTAGSASNAFVDVVGAERAAGAGCVVVAVDYRKAPEHPYPVALTDCVAALTWVLGHADELGVDPSTVTVGGVSAGANLAAALCLKNRDAGGPQIALQVLEVPCVDLTLSLPSHGDPSLGSDYALQRVDVDRLIPLYLGEGGSPHDPYVSPLLAADHSRLPPAVILSAEYDLLRDDGPAYARVLRAAGTPAFASVRPGHVHVSHGLTALMPSAAQWRDDVLAALRSAHDGSLERRLEGRLEGNLEGAR